MIQPLKRSITFHLPVKLVNAIHKLAESLHVSPSALLTALLPLPLQPPEILAPSQESRLITRHCSRCGQEFECYPYQRYTTCPAHRGKHLRGFKAPANAHPLKDWKEEK